MNFMKVSQQFWFSFSLSFNGACNIYYFTPAVEMHSNFHTHKYLLNVVQNLVFVFYIPSINRASAKNDTIKRFKNLTIHQ